MKPEDLFAALVKVVGLCVILMGIESLQQAIWTAIAFSSQGNAVAPLSLQLLTSPAILIIVGCLFLFRTGIFTKMAY